MVELSKTSKPAVLHEQRKTILNENIQAFTDIKLCKISGDQTLVKMQNSVGQSKAV